MVLTRILIESAQSFGCQPALSMLVGYRTITLSYSQVEELAKKVAVFLDKQGLKKGDRVLLCAPNSPYWICVFWGCLLRGCVVVPLAYQSTQELVEKIIHQTEAKLFFVSVRVRHLQDQDSSFVIEYLPEWVESCHVDDVVLEELGENDIAEIMYTSGTTGDPKGVILTHGNIGANIRAVREVVPLSGTKDRVLSILPLSHMFEQTIGFLVPFSEGAHIIYAHSHGAIRDLLKRYKITKLIAVPEFLQLMRGRILDRIQEYGLQKFFDFLLKFSLKIRFKPLQRILFFRLHKMFGGKLNIIACGGAYLDPELEQFWEALGVSIIQGYGLTETSPVITSNTLAVHKIGSVGKPLSNFKIRLTENGEIETSGPNVTSGYFKNEKKTRESFTDDGWFKTGDMGYVDEDGFWFLKGRKKYMIQGPAAQNIFPEDIETVLNSIRGVKDSCVVGIERAMGRVEVHAVLLLSNQSCQADKIIQEANEHLESYQQITGWTMWPEQDFPRSAIRKIKKEPVIEFIKGVGEEDEQSLVPVVSSGFTKILSSISGVDSKRIQPSTNLVQDLKFDSLMRVEFVSRIEEERGILIDERLITSKTVVEDLEKIINQAKPLTKMPRLKRWPLQWWARGLRLFTWGVLRLVGKIFFSLNVEGLENVPVEGCPVIFMPNHVSLIDGFIVSLVLSKRVGRKLSFAAAYDVLYEEYSSVRWLAELFFNAFPFPRKEHEHIATGLSNMGGMLDKGYSVVIFPEGKVSLDGKFQPLKRGTGLVAIEMRCPVVPIKIEGPAEFVGRERLIPRKRGSVTVRIGKPLRFSWQTSYDKATKEIEEALRNL